MPATVISLGYLRLGATDLDAWAEFAENLIGAMVAEADDERMLLRIDHYAYRLDIRKNETGGVLAAGWEVRSAKDLQEIVTRLEAHGYAVEWLGADAARERMVSEVVRFRDPEDNYDLELFWGLKSATPRFASPLGATFVADNLGLGHLFHACTDASKYSELYFDILGFQLSDHIDFPPDGEIVGVFTHCNPRHHSFAFAANAMRKQGIGHFMLEVTELDILGRALDYIEEKGIPVVQTFGRHTNDKMVSVYVLTPSGVAMEFGTGGILIDDATWRPVRYDIAHYWGHHR
ncbi:MAG: VOC family protein [Propionibacteriaceae bacterium]|nr:VOC family protein [Propionibacteriaceae bacterium]